MGQQQESRREVQTVVSVVSVVEVARWRLPKVERDKDETKGARTGERRERKRNDTLDVQREEQRRDTISLRRSGRGWMGQVSSRLAERDDACCS